VTGRNSAKANVDREVTLLWLELARSGTASHLHLRGTIERMAAADIPIGAVICSTDVRAKSVMERMRRLGRLVAKGIAASRKGILFARFHPFLLPVLIAWRVRGGVSVVSVQGALDHVVMDGVPLARLWASLNRWTLNQADGVVTVTDGLGRAVRQELSSPDSPLVVIPNGVSVASPLPPEERPEYPYAVFVGNLASWQGIDQMLAAVDHPEWPQDVRLVLIGDGSQEARVRRHTNPLVMSLGRLPYETAQTWLAGAVASLSFQDPKSKAGLGGYRPFKVMEAASLGVPSVVSDAPGLPEMAEQLGSCVVCAYEDTPALARAVSDIYTDLEMRRELSRAGRANIQAFTWQAESANLGAFLDYVLAHRGLVSAAGGQG
jgi:glycosyltransferase involved in cell wall biosynthesis